jgi:hypothetical protein
MDHSQFKANQTAAVYVADGLDAATQEEFELHMMTCVECVEDVETWRAIKINIPSRVRPATVMSRRTRPGHPVTTWRLAASVLIAGVIGVAGGWFSREARGPEMDSARSVFFNMPAVERGGDECTSIRLSADSKLAVVRIPGIAEGSSLIAVDSERHELSGASYFVRTQPDGSDLLRIEARVLVDRAVHLEMRGSEGSVQPVGCITGEIAH